MPCDGSRVSITIIRLSDVCLSVCPHDKNRTTETKIITNLAQLRIVHHDI